MNTEQWLNQVAVRGARTPKKRARLQVYICMVVAAIGWLALIWVFSQPAGLPPP